MMAIHEQPVVVPPQPGAEGPVASVHDVLDEGRLLARIVSGCECKRRRRVWIERVRIRDGVAESLSKPAEIALDTSLEIMRAIVRREPSP